MSADIVLEEILAFQTNHLFDYITEGHLGYLMSAMDCLNLLYLMDSRPIMYPESRLSDLICQVHLILDLA